MLNIIFYLNIINWEEYAMIKEYPIKKILTCFIIALFLGTCVLPVLGVSVFEINSSPSTDGNTLFVGGSGPGNFSTITDAIDSASIGDTVFVFSGIYIENVYVNITINLIGEDRQTTIIDANNKNDGIYVGFPADGVVVTGFTIKNSGNETHNAHFDAGIEIHSDYNHIYNNTFTMHPHYGLVFYASKENNISFNHFSYCNRTGIEIFAGPSNLIYQNLFYDNYLGISGVGNPNCKDNIIERNSFFRNNKGLSMFDSGSLIIKNNFYSNIDFNAMSHFDFFRVRPSRNTWKRNYWDDWIGFGPKFVPGFLGLNFDWNPVKEPYQNKEMI